MLSLRCSYFVLSYFLDREPTQCPVDAAIREGVQTDFCTSHLNQIDEVERFYAALVAKYGC
jgi:hypothetical protein